VVRFSGARGFIDAPANPPDRGSWFFRIQKTGSINDRRGVKIISRVPRTFVTLSSGWASGSSGRMGWRTRANDILGTREFRDGAFTRRWNIAGPRRFSLGLRSPPCPDVNCKSASFPPAPYFIRRTTPCEQRHGAIVLGRNGGRYRIVVQFDELPQTFASHRDPWIRWSAVCTLVSSTKSEWGMKEGACVIAFVCHRGGGSVGASACR